MRKLYGKTQIYTKQRIPDPSFWPVEVKMIACFVVFLTILLGVI